ncbi:DUF1919 domain-containing protein [Paenibacillus sp. LS1]|uniref:DUF1919 domain-containing protein n=1 Tax=Paenibacillus sp. LS1 TaxID=2992120 RepID=UPI002231B050|nr:DUF1919 domain-containing protein [Paenibacillus sp. LS1]MCW3795119.1 DUF1919 domain-containing protein [Paenibacillus sp. LS1]
MSKYRCIIWGTGIDYDMYINSIKYQELIGDIEIVGITSNQSIYQKVDQFCFIPNHELGNIDFDILIIASRKFFKEIQKGAISLGIDNEKIVNIKIFSLPNFDINKYLEIKKSQISIFSNNCWGGLTYNQLGMENYSPFINMFENEMDYLKILSDPQKYLNYELEFERYIYSEVSKTEYPVCYLNDVRLHFNHYTSLEEAVEKWNSRKKRINWDNLFIMMHTENADVADRFVELPYRNKVCFVPFETSKESLLSIHYKNSNELKEFPFWSIVNGLATGNYKFYDILDLLLGIRNDKRI